MDFLRRVGHVRRQVKRLGYRLVFAPPKGGGFHALRHAFASVLLHDGVDIAAPASYLGHHDPGFTLRIYVPLMPDAADRMRSVVDNALGAEADGPGTVQEVQR